MAVNQLRVPALTRAIVAELNRLGLEVEMIGSEGNAIPKNRYRYKEFYDTQTIAVAAGTETVMFDTSTSSRALHARGLAGCNLANPGQMDLNSDFFLLGIAVDPLAGIDSDDDGADDLTKLREYGIVKTLMVNEQKVLDELFFAALPANRGVQPGFPLAGAATYAFDGATNGAPGLPFPMLPAVSRIYIQGGEKVQVPCTHYAAASLTAVRTVRVILAGIEIEARGANV